MRCSEDAQYKHNSAARRRALGDERSLFAFVLVLEARRRVRLAGVWLLPRQRQQDVAKCGRHAALSFPVPRCHRKSPSGLEYGDSATSFHPLVDIRNLRKIK